ncbi:MAG: hypothetical protein KY397_01950 [Gemmatimonadetes bacterium]|nr:hypothetical protein [Gemmatimonadota bacterium]
MNAAEIARVLDEIGRLLRFRGRGNPFKARAYVNAARTLRSLTEPLEVLIAEDRLRELPGVGEAIERKIVELHETGTLPLYESLKEEIPLGVVEMSAVPGLGEKRARAAWTELGIDSLEALEEAAASGALESVPGFGPKTVARVIEGIALARRSAGRLVASEARRVAAALVTLLAGRPDVQRVETAGEVRRRANLVEQIGLVAAAEDPAAAVAAFLSHPVVTHGEADGPVATARLSGGTAARLRVSTVDSWGAALVAETGSADHLTRLSERAAERGIELSPEGLVIENATVACPREEDVYEALGLPWIPPELREGRDEVEAAAAGRLPDLVDFGDLRGVVHCHTEWSDGRASIERMAERAKALGFGYLVVCDHSRSAFYAGGLPLSDLKRQRRAIEAANAALEGFTILAGSEVDIRPDGTLDWPDEVLADLDVVVASVHGQMRMSRRDQTDRIVRALENPWVDVLGHPTGRLLLKREGYDVDLERVLDAAAEHGVAVEVNGDPRRLDLDWEWHGPALERGILLSLDPDAHGPETIEPLVANAVGAARKGGVAAEDVLNARDVDGFRAGLRRNRG